MARNWFQHNYDARNDEKILELRAELGWKGYGLFYAFLEMMCETGNGSLDISKIGGLSLAFNLPKQELLDFINTCIDIGLFYKNEDGLLMNKRIVNHMEKMRSFSEAGKKGAKKRWSKQTDRGAIATPKPTHDDPNADKIRLDNKNHYGETFEKFWDLYDLKQGKKKAWLEWKKLSEDDIEKIFKNVPIFLTHFSSKQYTPRPRKYLYNRYWEDEGYQKPEGESEDQDDYMPINPQIV